MTNLIEFFLPLSTVDDGERWMDVKFNGINFQNGIKSPFRHVDVENSRFLLR